MWVGRHDSQPLGGVAGHLYVEFDSGAIDPERLREAATDVGDASSDAAGDDFSPTAPSRSITAQAPAKFPVTVHDFRDLDSGAVGERLARHSGSQVAPAARRAGIRADPLVAARRKIAPARRFGHAGRRRDELPHPDGRFGEAVSGRRFRNWATATGNTVRRLRGARPARGRLHDADRDWWSRRIPELRTRPGCRRRAENHFPATVLDVGSGWIRRPETRCSRTPAPWVSPPR